MSPHRDQPALAELRAARSRGQAESRALAARPQRELALAREPAQGQQPQRAAEPVRQRVAAREQRQEREREQAAGAPLVHSPSRSTAKAAPSRRSRGTASQSYFQRSLSSFLLIEFQPSFSDVL